MKNNNKLQAGYGGALRLHWQWSVLLSFSLLILDGILFWKNRTCGLIALAFTVIYFGLTAWIYFYFRPGIFRELVTFGTKYGQVQKEILQKFVLPSALLEPDGKILWMNDQMIALTEKSKNYHKNISTIFPEINRGSLPAAGWEQDIHTTCSDKEYRAHVQRISMAELLEATDIAVVQEKNNYLYMVCLFDETQLRSYVRQLQESSPVVGLIYIDNFDEALEKTDEVHQSLLSVLVERRINKYFSGVNGLVKKLEKDKYVIVLNQKALDNLTEDRFSILDSVKTVNIGNDVSMTISAGFGVEGKTYLADYELARSGIEMALARGGDQVVIRNGDDMTFFGGKSQGNEKSTRVKARVKAQGLRELILAQERVVAMGHAVTDMDSLGAAVGIWRAATAVGKPAHIVLGELNTNIRDWVARFRENRDYPEDMFITHEEAIRLTDNTTAVIVVDTNRANIVECREILSQTSNIVVFDHHRQATDTIEPAALSYIEPSASSACEMVAEILQYFEENVRLRNLEADCIYAGIVLDTQSFVTKTGVRTFEAAAYLRRCGADMTRVRKALRDNMTSYMAKMEAVGRAQTFMDHYAISVCDGDELEDPNVVGAQAANDLLNIVGVKASFVLTKVGNTIFISARSIDELNVQLVMERLGGGGHMNIAGAQLYDVTAEQAQEMLQKVLYEMTQEGSI